MRPRGRPTTSGGTSTRRKRLARDSLAEARRSVQALRPQTLDTAALPEAIGEVVDGWSRLNGVPRRADHHRAARPLLPEIETDPAAYGAGGAGQRGPARGRDRVALTLSYMEDLVTLDVRDDGTGFDPSAQREPGSEGGYGLSAMRERVSRIAGTLEVESEPGGGTAISACVPAIPVGSRRVIGVLIVDDHPVVRDGLRGMFAGDDRFDRAGRGRRRREALAVARSVDPDVVLMDLRMPEMDGVSAIRALAAQGSRARVLVLTTYDTDSDVLPAIKAGATGYLLKDTPREELFRAVSAAYRASRCSRPRWRDGSWARCVHPRRNRSASASSRCSR